MSCDDSIQKSGPCTEADGVPGAAAETTWPSEVQPQARCPHCNAWVTEAGVCNNADCGKHSEQVVDMAEHHLLARCGAESLDTATVEDVEEAAYQMGYEGLHVAHIDHNPFPEDDERHYAFNRATLEGQGDFEYDAEIVRVIVDGAGDIDENIGAEVRAVLEARGHEETAGVVKNSVPDRRFDFERVPDVEAPIYETPEDLVSRACALRDTSEVALSSLDLSVNVSFSANGRRWGDGHVSVGPARPVEPFEAGVELVDQYERVGHGTGGRTMPRELYHPTRTYEVQMVIPSEEASSFDTLAERAEDQLRETEGNTVAQGTVDPVDLDVERRPDGTLWVTGLFDVVRDEPVRGQR